MKCSVDKRFRCRQDSLMSLRQLSTPVTMWALAAKSVGRIGGALHLGVAAAVFLALVGDSWLAKDVAHISIWDLRTIEVGQNFNISGINHYVVDMGRDTHKNAEVLTLCLSVAVACALFTFGCCFALGCKLTRNPIIVWLMSVTSLLTVASFATGFTHGMLISIKFQECPFEGPCAVKAASLGYSCIACMPGLLMSLSGLYICLRAVRMSSAIQVPCNRRGSSCTPSLPLSVRSSTGPSRKSSSSVSSVSSRAGTDDSVFANANPHFRADKLTRAHVPLQARVAGRDSGRLLASLEFAKRPVARHSPAQSNQTPILSPVSKPVCRTPTVVRNLTANPLLMTWEEACAVAPPGVTCKPQPVMTQSRDNSGQARVAEQQFSPKGGSSHRRRRDTEDKTGDATAAAAMTGNTDAACCCMIAFL